MSEKIDFTNNVNLMLGDCLERMKEIPDGSVDLILVDPPYNISRDNNFHTMKDREGRKGIDFGEWDFKSFEVGHILQALPKLSRNGSLVVFCAFEQIGEYIDVIGSELLLKDKLIWEKSNPMPRNRDRRYVSNIEPILWFVNKGSKWVFNRKSDKYDTCVMRYPSESGGGFKRYHPTQKTLGLVEELVGRHSNEGDTVLDMYLGSGTTGVAAVNTNRKFIGVEMDESYFNIAKKRIEESGGVVNVY